jgi:hypothetical protein
VEDRWVPATIRFDGTNLFIYNPTITVGASKLSVTETATGFQVKDGVANNGAYAVTGNITIQGNNAKDTVTVTLNATGPAGGVSVTTGNGASSVSFDGSAAGAFIAGNSRISTGNGVSTITFGAATGLTERGSLYVTGRSSGANSLTIGGGGTPSTVSGLALISGFPVATLGKAGDTLAGGVVVSNSGNASPSTVTLGGSDLGNFVLSSGAGATSLAVNGNVLGNAQVGLNNGANSLTLGGGAAAISVGNLYVNGGNGANSITLSGANAVTDLGNAYVSLGNGNNTFGSSANFTVNNNLFINNGNGNLNIAANPFQGTVGNNLTVNTGNGNNTVTVDTSTGGAVQGTFSYTGGNGGNNLTINNPSATATFNLNVHFGNNAGTGNPATSDVFTIGAGGNMVAVTNVPAGPPSAIALNLRLGNSGANVFWLGGANGTSPPDPGTVTGSVNFGPPSTASTLAPATPFKPGDNYFMDSGYVWTGFITLINIPA